MKKIIMPVFTCDHCGKIYKLAPTCMKHEECCRKNPLNQHPCFNCKHLERKKSTAYYESQYSEWTNTFNSFYCKKKKIFLYSRKAEINGHSCARGVTEDAHEQMPLECGDFSNDFWSDEGITVTSDEPF